MKTFAEIQDEILSLQNQLAASYAIRMRPGLDVKKILEERKSLVNRLEELNTLWIPAWANQVKQIDIIVFSIGSYGSQEQQQPKFITALPDLNKGVAVLNIDPQFSETEKSVQVGNTRIDYLKGSVDEHLQLFSQLKDAIQDLLNANRIVILMYHTVPTDCLKFKDLIQPNLTAMKQDQFFVIGSYHSIQPVAIYHANFFENLYADKNADEKKRIVNFIGKLWQAPVEFTQDELDKTVLVNDFQKYGNFFSNIDAIQIPHLIAAQHENESMQNPFKFRQ